GWVGIQKRFTQSGPADQTGGQLLPLVARIAETQLPIPSLEVIAKFSHLATEADIEQVILVGELIVSGAGVVNAAKPNTSSHREAASVRKKIWNRRIRDCERIKRVDDWHTDATETKIYVRARDLEWVGIKRNSCEGPVEK